MSEIKQIFFQFLILLFCLESSLSQKCGFSDNSTRIVGGDEAGFLKWPWMAKLEILFKDSRNGDYTNLCGGTLISDQWVLTAAHCFNKPSPTAQFSQIKLTFGEHDVTINEGTEVVSYSSEYYPWDTFNQATFANDNALIKLRQKLDFNGKHKYLQPICLPPKGVRIDPNRCWVTGWGLTYSGGMDATVLQEINLPITHDYYCRENFRNFRADLMVCAGYYRDYNSCQGDSGGPLQCQLPNNVWIQHGIVSFGSTDCALQGVPSVYTKVSVYVDRIKSFTGIK